MKDQECKEMIFKLKGNLSSGNYALPWSELIFGQARTGAVLVPMMIYSGSIRIMCVRRQSFLRRHPGEIAFPGGQKDSDDITPVDTALREMEEETGIDSSDIDIIGLMDREYTVGSDFGVVPVAGLINSSFPPSVVPEEQEIAEIFYFDLIEDFEGPEWKTFWSRNREHSYPVYRIDSNTVIWGLTGRILFKLRNLLMKEDCHESYR